MRLKKTLATLATLGTGLSMSAVALAGPASAATSPLLPGYGFDGNAHIVVSGGSDTTYQAMTAIATLWNTSSIGGCATQTSATSPSQSPQLNQCLTTDGTPTLPLGNYDRDTVANASPTGSSAGIGSLNGFTSAGGAGTYDYQGANGAVDFARSSRAPNQTTGSCPGGNELTCDTFWGFAEDGVRVFGFGTHAGVNLTPAQVVGIYQCNIVTWGQITDPANPSSDPAPIVPFGMNTASGTYATFNTFLDNNGGGTLTADTNLSAGLPATYPSAAGKCVRPLSTGIPPFENDVKPLFNDVQTNQGGLTTSGVNDPDNWLWFGSNGLLSAFPYDNSFTTSGSVTYTGGADPLFNSTTNTYVAPGASTVLNLSYPLVRTLYHVTKVADADCPYSGGQCNFTANPGSPIGTTGVKDLNVLGASGGTGGAVREFTRFLCRANATQDATDPYSGGNLFNEVQSARAASGFTAVPGSLKSPGSACEVMSSGSSGT